MDKRLVIVAGAGFGRGWGGHTQRIFDIAIGLSERSWSPELIAAVSEEQLADFFLDGLFPGPIHKFPFLLQKYPLLLDFKGARSLWRLLYRYAWFEQCTWDTEVRWMHAVCERLGDQRPDSSTLVWGVTTGELAGPITAWKLASRWQVPYVVEIHDPVPDPTRPGGFKPWQHKGFDACLRDASLVITTTASLAEHMQSERPYLRGKTRTFYLSYDDRRDPVPHPAGLTPQDDFVLLHAGFLYGGAGRNARSLVRGLSRAASTDPAFGAVARLILLGAGPGGEEAMTEAARLGIADMVKNLPAVSFDESIDAMGRAHVQVVIKFADRSYDRQIPGKLFHAMGVGRPILGIMGQHTEAASILRRSGIGIVVDNDDERGISKAILNLWRARREGIERLAPDLDYISQFSRSCFADRMAGELMALTAGVS